MFDLLAPYIVAGLLVATGYMFTRWLACVEVAKHWKASAEISFRISDELSEQVQAMKAEGCRAMGALENIFNGVTAGGMPHSKLVKEIAKVAADELLLCTPCDHKEEVERLRTELDNELADVEMLCRIASEVYDTITRGRISKPNTMPFEILSVVDELATEERNEAFKEGREVAAAELLVANLNAESWQTAAQIAEALAEEAERLLGLVQEKLVVSESDVHTMQDHLAVERSKGRIL